MTGMEVLEQQLAQRYNMTQNAAHAALQGVTVKRVLQIFAENTGIVQDAVLDSLKEREEGVLKSQREVENERRMLVFEKKRVAECQARADNMMKKVQEERKNNEDFYANIMQAEMAETRDRLRLLEIFKQNVEVETAQNNSVYIAGVASILSGTQVFPNMGKRREE